MNLEPPKGVLVVGVQGCGKSIAAKFIAHEWGLPLLKLDAGRLYEKYVGESEKNLRKAMDLAEAMAPVVLWIDEIEKVFSQGRGSDSDGGLSQRLFGAFLTWLQEKKQEVFVVGAANDLFGVPPELLRKGRFDEIFFVPSTSACASRTRSRSICSGSPRPRTASAAPRSNRPSSPPSTVRCTANRSRPPRV